MTADDAAHEAWLDEVQRLVATAHRSLDPVPQGTVAAAAELLRWRTSADVTFLVGPDELAEPALRGIDPTSPMLSFSAPALNIDVTLERRNLLGAIEPAGIVRSLQIETDRNTLDVAVDELGGFEVTEPPGRRARLRATVDGGAELVTPWFLLSPDRSS